MDFIFEMARRIRFKLSWLCLFILVAVAQGPVRLITPELLASASNVYGKEVVPRLLKWGQLVGESEPLKDKAKLISVNDYFNQNIQFTSDQKHWAQEDYWATPLESLATDGGDCEDFVIAKYFSLIQAGVKQEKLRITYVKALKLNQAHMVLAYYETPRSDPLILDNINHQILNASKRRDLSPVYSFNGLGMWLERMKGSSIRIGEPDRLNMWKDLLIRMEEQDLSPWLNIP